MLLTFTLYLLVYQYEECLPLTDMWYINGRVVSLVLRRKARDFFYISAERMERMKKTVFYIIKDRFFEDMPDPYLKGNKVGNRPYYYCFEDTDTGIYWMIPLSGRIDKFRKIIEKKEHTAKIIEQKARKVLGMLKRGVKFMPTQPDVLSILEKLKHNF